METTLRVLLLFFTYAFLGWSVEVAFAAITLRKLVNRGFLCGPVCPIYGFGMLALVGAMQALPIPQQGVAGVVGVFFTGMVITTAVELVGGWALFKIFHARWWDYSDYRGNLGGYICPQFALLWGLGSVIMIEIVHPFLMRVEGLIPAVVVVWLDVIFALIFAADFALSTAAAIGLNKKLREIDEMRARLRRTSDKLTTLIGTNAMTADTLLDEQKLQLALGAMEHRDNVAELQEEVREHAAALRAKLDNVGRDRFGAGRLLKAFPTLQSDSYEAALESLRARLTPLGSLAQRARSACAALKLQKK